MQKRNASLYWVKVVSLGIVLGFGLQFAQAWTNPVSAPPAGNVAGPITTGAGYQAKTGSLGVGGNVWVGGYADANDFWIRNIGKYASALDAVSGCELTSDTIVAYCVRDSDGSYYNVVLACTNGKLTNIRKVGEAAAVCDPIENPI